MDRRGVIKSLALGGGAAIGIKVFPTPAIASSKKHHWRLALPIPKSLPIWGTGAIRFANNVKIMSGGRLNIKVYGAGELMPAFATFDAVRTGEIEMHHVAAYYYQGQVPEAALFTSIPFGMGSTGTNAWLQFGGGQALWNELLEPYDVFSISAGSTGPQLTGWYKKEINSPSDLKGLKIRVPGIPARVFAKLGAVPVLIPGAEVFTSLSTGVIDAVEWIGPYHDYLIGLHKAAQYLYLGAWHEPGPILELMINNKAWKTLDPSLQMIVRAAASELGNSMLLEFSAKNGEYLQKIKDTTSTIIKRVPPDVILAMRKATSSVMDEVTSNSRMADRIYKSYVKFQNQFEAYNDESVTTVTSALKG